MCSSLGRNGSTQLQNLAAAKYFSPAIFSRCRKLTSSLKCLAYFRDFGKIKWGLWDKPVLCVCACLSIPLNLFVFYALHVDVDQLVEWEFAEKPKYLKETLPMATLSSTNSTWPEEGLNPGRYRGNWMTYHLNYGKTVRPTSCDALCLCKIAHVTFKPWIIYESKNF
jgi:hypothetical protein